MSEGADGTLKHGYMDGCFDVMHSGHYNAIRQSAQTCDRLVVGIHSDKVIAENKCEPVMKQAERYGLLEHVKWLDTVAYDTPYSLSIPFLDSVKADFCIHGDDMPVDSNGVGAYDAMRDAGKLRVIRRTDGVSTTVMISRLLARGSPDVKKSEDSSTKRASYVTGVTGGGLSLASTRMITQFSEPQRTPEASDVVVYVVGHFDMFHVGMAQLLCDAKAMGTYLVVGIHEGLDDGHQPIQDLHERMLQVLGCKHVDEVVMRPPETVSEDLINTLKIARVVRGVGHRPKRAEGVCTQFDPETDPRYAEAKKLKIYAEIESKWPHLTSDEIARRVCNNADRYTNRNAKREKMEQEYYDDKFNTPQKGAKGADGAAAPELVGEALAALRVPETVPTATAAYTTFADDASLGKPAPSLDTLEYVKDDVVSLVGDKPTCILFFAKFAKGDYTTVVGVSELVALFPQVQFLGISVDPEKKDAEGFLKKIGTALPENYIDDLKVDFPVAWDAGKTVKAAFQKTSALASLGASATFVIDGTGTIVWREQFGQGYFPPKSGQLKEQLRRLVVGEQLISNGDKPAEEEEEEEVMGGEDDYDSDLGF